MSLDEVPRVTLDRLPTMLTAEQAATVLREAGWRIARTAVYEACKRGEIDHRRLGRQLRIPRSEIVRLAGIENGRCGPDQ